MQIYSLLSLRPSQFYKPIYKAFDNATKEDIKEHLYFLDKSGQISRVKHGSTYVVSLHMCL